MSTRSALDKYREGSNTVPYSHRTYIPLENQQYHQNPHQHQHHHSTPAISHHHRSFSATRFSRRSLAAIALEKTSSAFNNLVSLGASSNSSVRSSQLLSPGGVPIKPLPTLPTPSPQPSLNITDEQSGGGHDQARTGAEDYFSRPSIPPSTEKNGELLRGIPGHSAYTQPNHSNSSVANNSSSNSKRDTVSESAGEEDPNMPFSKMHQTSSRLLRMTADDRPFARDFKDLFSTLMVSLKLESHRVRFSKFDHTFTSDEAINNLGSLKFSQSNRMPDPKDPSRIVTTTTTTTFSMAKEMARSVCQKFVDARFMEPVDGRISSIFPIKGVLFQMTPKGIHVLHRFCQRNGITARHVMEVLESPRNTMQLVILERDMESDQLSRDKATIDVIFRRFAGVDGPNLKSSVSSSDSDSVSDYINGTIGVKMAKERKVGDKIYQNTFTGKAAVDWILDCCTAVDARETTEIAAMFVKNNLMYAIAEDRGYMHQVPSAVLFQPTKYAIYGLTEQGKRVCGWIARDKIPSSSLDGRITARDSNNARLNHILQDPALRLLFREFLRDSLCEENLAFYLDVSAFTADYHRAEKVGAFSKMDAVKETLASAYGLYNAFLAPGSPCELNIEHALRNSLASRMTRAVSDDESMVLSLTEVVSLFEMAQVSVFKLMSSDSVPKFVRDPRYAIILQDHDFDLNGTRSYSPTQITIPERSASRSA